MLSYLFLTETGACFWCKCLIDLAAVEPPIIDASRLGEIDIFLFSELFEISRDKPGIGEWVFASKMLITGFFVAGSRITSCDGDT